MLKIKLKQSLDEMSLKNYRTIGNFDKPGPFKGVDHKLVTSPGYLRKLTRAFSNVQQEINIWMSNKPGLSIERETGSRSDDDIRRMFPKEAQQIFSERNDDAITVIFIGNFGDRKVMMTPWIVAHRMGHAINASRRGRAVKNSPSAQAWKEMEEAFFSLINSSLKQDYGAHVERSIYSMQNNKLYKALFNEIGTQKSSRDRQIIRMYEFIYECFAQFLLTGSVKLKPFPKKLDVGRKVFGRPTEQYVFRGRGSDEERELAAEDLQDILSDYFNAILIAATGEIFVM